MQNHLVLRNLNIGAAVLHGSLLIFIVYSMCSAKKEDIKGLDPYKPGDLGKLENNTTVYLLKDSDVKLQDKCKYWGYEGYKNAFLKIDLSVSLLLFTIITFLAHCFYALCNKQLYDKYISKGSNIFRWVEYSLSAPIMLCILAILAGVRNQNQLLLIFALTVVQMIQGYYVEKAIKQNESALLPTLIGWFCLIVAWFSVFDRWYNGLNDAFKNFDECKNIIENEYSSEEDVTFTDAQPPKELIHLIWVVFFLFASFGGISLYQIIANYRSKTECTKQNNPFFTFINGVLRFCSNSTVNKKKNKYSIQDRAEISYIILSFVSKALLIFWSFGSIFPSKLNWLKTCTTFEKDTCLRKFEF